MHDNPKSRFGPAELADPKLRDRQGQLQMHLLNTVAETPLPMDSFAGQLAGDFAQSREQFVGSTAVDCFRGKCSALLRRVLPTS